MFAKSLTLLVAVVALGTGAAQAAESGATSMASTTAPAGESTSSVVKAGEKAQTENAQAHPSADVTGQKNVTGLPQSLIATPQPAAAPLPGSVKVTRPGEFKPTEKQMQDWNAPIKGFHPIKRIVRPIWKLRQEAVELQEHIAGLRKPMDGLQPAFNSLEGKMSAVDSRMSSVLGELSGVNGSLNQLTVQMSKIDDELPAVVTGVRDDMKEVMKVRQDLREVTKVRNDLQTIGNQMKRLEGPLNQIQGPINAVIKPLASVQANVAGVSGQMSGVQTQIANMQQDLDAMNKEMKEIREPLSAVAAPLSDVRSQLKELNSLLVTLVWITALCGISAVLAVVGGFVIAFRFRDKFFRGYRQTEESMKWISRVSEEHERSRV